MTTPPPNHEMRDQIKLPVGVAFQVVLQGLRIRLGRSLVTVMGVVLGIAFLMSILTSQILKAGVAKEQTARLELQRMNNFLRAEMGAPAGKTLGVLRSGQLSALETRFLQSLAEQGVRTVPDEFQNSHRVLLMGDGPVPALTGLKRIVTTQNIAGRQFPDGIHTVQLARQLRPEELAKLEAEKRDRKSTRLNSSHRT